MLFVFDLDGTICFDGHHLPEVIAKQLRRAEQFGHKIAFASARSYRDCLGILGETFRNHLVICLNGGLVYQEGKLMAQDILPEDLLNKLLAFCQQEQLPYFLDNHFDYASAQADKIPFFATVDPLKLAQHLPVAELHQPTKLVVYLGDHEKLVDAFASLLPPSDQVSAFYHEQEKCFYINPSGVTKGGRVEACCGKDFVAFGNDKNDLGFFERAHYAVQVGDYEPLTALADLQVPAQAEAVATAIGHLYEQFKG